MYDIKVNDDVEYSSAFKGKQIGRVIAIAEVKSHIESSYEGEVICFIEYDPKCDMDIVLIKEVTRVNKSIKIKGQG